MQKDNRVMPPARSAASQLARNAYSLSMLRHIDQRMPAWRLLVNAWGERLVEDLNRQPARYDPHIDRAASIHPEMPDYWQAIRSGDCWLIQDVETSAPVEFCMAMAFAILLVKTFEGSDLFRQAQQDLLANPQISKWCDSLRDEKIPPTSAELAYVAAHPRYTYHAHGRQVFALNDDPVERAAYERVHPAARFEIRVIPAHQTDQSVNQ